MRTDCPVCGGELRESVSRCASCPLNRGCKMICCERCGYQTVMPRSVTVEFFKRLFGRRRKRDATSGVSQATD